MDSQSQSPAWSDGQANRELLDSLDEIGGSGEDLADQEMFNMLDEIESLTNEKRKASDLLQGSGRAIEPKEPKLRAVPSPAETARLAEQIKDLPDFSETPKFLRRAPETPVQDVGQPSSAIPAATLDQFSALAAKQNGNDHAFSPEPSLGSFDPDSISNSNLNVNPSINSSSTTMGEPLLAKLAASVAPASQSLSAGLSPLGALSAPASPQRTLPRVEVKESTEVAAPERVMELSSKKKVDPEKFLPPDFFDPRDRKQPKKWGRWLFLALVIGGMTALAGYLIVKSYKDTRPTVSRGIGDLTKPAEK
jgi:hypothetical protein